MNTGRGGGRTDPRPWSCYSTWGKRLVGGGELPDVRDRKMQDFGVAFNFFHGAEEGFHASSASTAWWAGLEEDGTQDDTSTVSNVESDDHFEGS